MQIVRKIGPGRAEGGFQARVISYLSMTLAQLNESFTLPDSGILCKREKLDLSPVAPGDITFHGGEGFTSNTTSV